MERDKIEPFSEKQKKISSPDQQYLSIDDISQLELESVCNSLIKGPKPIVFGICGGSNSGKSFTTKWLQKKFQKLKIRVSILKEKLFLLKKVTN